MITIFTPTYNRAYRLPALYESLQRQTCRDFEWLVVDDGSTDNTPALFERWTAEANFPMRYLRQSNGGKHRAINRGAQEAQGEWFFIVDSDDYLTDNAVERILVHIDKIKDCPDVSGVTGMKYDMTTGKRVAGEAHFKELLCSRFDFRYKYKVGGDLAEVHRTALHRQYPFPDVEGENFCSEAYVWAQLAAKYKILFFNENIYACEYLADGLTQNSLRIRAKNPRYAMLVYEKIVHSLYPQKVRWRAAINYWRFYFHASRTNIAKRSVSVVFYPLGFLIYCHDKWVGLRSSAIAGHTSPSWMTTSY